MLTRVNPLWTSLRFEGEGGGSGGSGSGDEPHPEFKKLFDSLAVDKDGKKVVEFDQDQLTKMAITSKNQGRDQVRQQLTQTLGMSVDEAKKLIDAHNAAIEASKTEVQREKDAAEKARKEAEVATAAAAQERHDLRIEKALLKAGVDPAKVERARRLVDAEAGADEAAIKVAVESVKEDFPSIFGVKEEGKGPKVPSGAPAGTKPKPHGSETGYDRGKQRAAARNPQKIAS